MIERGRSAMEVRTTRQEPMASTSKSFLDDYRALPPVKPMLSSRLCSNARSWSSTMKAREAPRLASAPGKAAAPLAQNRPATTEPEDTLKRTVPLLPFEMQVSAGHLACAYLKYNGMKSYHKYTGLSRLPR